MRATELRLFSPDGQRWRPPEGQICDVTPAIRRGWRRYITDATLVGHSYGGMVIAAAADRASGRTSRLVYLDAFVPRDGESWWMGRPHTLRRTPRPLQTDPGWQVHDLPTRHDAMHEAPEAVAALLLDERLGRWNARTGR